MDFPILTTILVAPLIAMALVMVLRESATRLIRGVSLMGAGVPLVLSLYLWLHFDPSQPGFQWTERFGGVEGWGIQFLLAADGLSIPLLVLTSIIIFTALLVARSMTTRVKEFHALLLFLVAGALGVLLAVDLFFFFLFYEIAVIPMFLLVNVWGTGDKVYAANKLTLYLLAGSGFVLIGFFMLFFESGLNSFDLKAMLEQATFSRELQIGLFLLFLIGFGTLSAAWPFHSWSPDGYASAPTSASMLHAAVLKTLGGYGLLRVALPLFPLGAQFWQPLMLTIGVMNILYAAFCVMAQKDLKYVIGYSCVSHMGIVMLGIGSLTQSGLNGAMLQMFSHGIMTALLFATTGYIYETRHTRQLNELGGLFKDLPRAATLFSIGAFAALGLPGLSGFVAEFLVLYSVFTVSPWFGAFAIFGMVLSAIYMLRVLKVAFWGGPHLAGGTRFVASAHEGGHDKAWPSTRSDMTLNLALPGLILASILFLFGLYPRLFTDFVAATSSFLLRGIGN